ncbi:MAG TPA: UDP-N-acetylmuramoyl-tripeptide--D-alanyl-D-alanine ligase [Mucilaginibacter sp.]|jgi:UDP-N-acetylmuramoyl-tripeptide--D-alanyl-D-alanine ligase|nr:UDP-N-acetylmuramoyl-tripeptide--D-alanyl-D-alanine ligase [Mucilaginibacter sp.]
MTIEQLYQIYRQHPVIATDTRKITPGSIFFALKGDKFDANTFAQQALGAGAAYAVIDNAQYQSSDKCLLVDDVLATLQDLARHHRGQLTIPVIGLTGTNGKTTTKELIKAVLSQHFNTVATQGNLNNHIGVPLTILGITAAHEMAVIEMGANHIKEIELLCSISQPTHGLITNVGKAHLEGFGSIEGVKTAKGELYDFLATHNGVAFINSNNPILMSMQGTRKFTTSPVFYGDQVDDLVSGEITENAPLLSLKWTNNTTGQDYSVKTQLTGAYNLDNILAAISIGLYFKIPATEINVGIKGYQPRNNRSQVVQTATNTLICDYYNANPSSMTVAIENIGKITANRKVLILGDMFEMGAEAATEHKGIIEKALATPVDECIFIGKEFSSQRAIAEGKTASFYETAEDAITALKTSPIKNSTILIKGSRGMALERLVELF